MSVLTALASGDDQRRLRLTRGGVGGSARFGGGLVREACRVLRFGAGGIGSLAGTLGFALGLLRRAHRPIGADDRLVGGRLGALNVFDGRAGTDKRRPGDDHERVFA
jgi:hypothetical protein